MNRKLRDFILRPIVLLSLSVALFAFKVHAGPGHGESEVSQVQATPPKDNRMAVFLFLNPHNDSCM